MELEEKLMKLRKEHGLSQEQFGEEIGVSRQAVSKWENGETKPDIDKIKTISEKYNVTYEYLLNDLVEENNNKPKEEQMNVEEPTKKKRKFLKRLLKVIKVLLIVYIILVIYKFVMYTKINIVANSFDEENYGIVTHMKTMSFDNQGGEVLNHLYKYEDIIVGKTYYTSFNKEEIISREYPIFIRYFNLSTGEKYELQWNNDHYDIKDIEESVNLKDFEKAPAKIVENMVPSHFLDKIICSLDPTRIVLPNGTMFYYSTTFVTTVTLNDVGLIDSVVGKNIYGDVNVNRYSYNYSDWMTADNYKNPLEEYKDLIKIDE